MEDPDGSITDTRANPYAPPASHTTEVIVPTKVHPRKIMRAWERMRLRYNLILLLPGLLVIIIFVGTIHVPIEGALFGSVIVAIAANICYFFGVTSECLVCALFKTSEHPGYRKTAYIAGITFSLVIFALVCLPAAIMAF